MAGLWLSRRRFPFRSWNLQNKLLGMLVSLLVLSSGSLFLLHLGNERRLLSQVLDYTADLSAAIEIAEAQPLNEDDLNRALADYVERLRRLGVKDVSITDDSDEVQVSTNPGHVGKKLRRQKDREWVIRGVLGDEASAGQRMSTFTIPLVVGDRRVGTLAITRILDDFSSLSRKALASSLVALAAIFALGIGLSLYLSRSFAAPVERLGKAAQAVASGNLDVELSEEGGSEARILASSFNEMVRRLRDQKALEERLHHAERAAALGRMGSAVAHEVRNPLNFLSLSIDHMSARLRRSEEIVGRELEPTLATMKQEVGRLNRLVSEFQSFGRPMKLHRALCRVEERVLQVVSLVEARATDQGVSIHLDLEDALPELWLDRELIETCISNLAINALDAMPDGGKLGISLHRAEGAEHAKYGSVELAVTDSGNGMTDEELRRAFEPYFSTKTAGIGLGLSLTRQILTEHEATIRIESRPGSGSTVRVRFPRVGPAAFPAGARDQAKVAAP